MMRASGAKSKAGYAVGLGLIALAAVLVYDAANMQVPPNYAAYGPQIFPYISVVVLVATGLYFLWQTATAKPNAVHPDTDRPEWIGVFGISVGLLAQVFLIETLGFVLSAAFLFFAVAWSFRSGRPVRDAIIAVALSLTTYLVFTYLLNLQLPPGILKGII